MGSEIPQTTQIEPTMENTNEVTVERGFILRPTTLLGIIIVGLCAVSLAYLGGVMSGRASVEKEYKKAALENSRVAREAEVQGDGILAPEELEFSRVLRNDNRLSPKNGPNLKPARAEREKTPEQNQPPLETAQGQPETALVPEKLPPSDGLSDYIFQVAALKNEDSADALRQRLEGRGLRTYLKREGKLLLIQVKLRGDAARSRELLAILGSLKLGKPILISQKPARD